MYDLAPTNCIVMPSVAAKWKLAVANFDDVIEELLLDLLKIVTKKEGRRVSIVSDTKYQINNAILSVLCACGCNMSQGKCLR